MSGIGFRAARAWLSVVTTIVMTVLAGGAVTAQPTKKPATRPQAVDWAVGEKVECKSGFDWDDVTVENKSGRWILIVQSRGFHEWVEPWRLRRKGSKEDKIGNAIPHQSFLPNKPVDPAPRIDPCDPPPPGASTMDMEALAEAARGDRLAPSKPVNRKGLREVKLVTGTPHALVPDPSTVKVPALVSMVAELPAATGEFIEWVPYYRVSAAGIGIIATRSARAPFTDFYTPDIIHHIDFTQGKVIGEAPAPLPLAIGELSQDGKQFLTHELMTSGTFGNRFDYWSMTEVALTHIRSFKPYDNQHTAHFTEWVTMLGQNHVVTLNFDGALGVWDIKGNGIWWAYQKQKLRPIASPAGKYLAVPILDGIAFLDGLTGKTLSVQSTAGIKVTNLSFRPDGRLFAAAAPGLLVVWDLTTGLQANRLELKQITGKKVEWVGEKYVLADGRWLIDLKQEQIVREFEVAGAIKGLDSACIGDWFTYVAKRETSQKPVVGCVKLIDENLAAVLNPAGAGGAAKPLASPTINLTLLGGIVPTAGK